MTPAEVLFLLRRTWRYLYRQSETAPTDHAAAIAYAHAIAVAQVLDHLEAVEAAAARAATLDGQAADPPERTH